MHQLAPKQKEAPFLVAQTLVMALFILLGVVALKKFRMAQAQLAYAE